MQLIVMAIGAAMAIGGGVVIARALRDQVHRDFSDARFRCAWASTIAWFGALPLVSVICDAAALPPRVRDIGYTLVLVIGLAATLWFVATGLLSRRAEFRSRQQAAIEAGGHASRYFWRPWPIFGWTLGIGSALVLGGGVAVGSIMGAVGGSMTVAEVEQLSQTIADVLVISLYAVVLIAMDAGLMRWYQLRRETRAAARMPAVEPENSAKAPSDVG